MFGIFLFLTYYLQQTLGYSAVSTGLAFLPMSGVLVITAAAVSAALTPRISPRILIPSGLALSALSMYLFTGLTVSSSYVERGPCRPRCSWASVWARCSPRR